MYQQGSGSLGRGSWQMVLSLHSLLLKFWSQKNPGNLNWFRPRNKDQKNSDFYFSHFKSCQKEVLESLNWQRVVIPFTDIEWEGQSSPELTSMPHSWKLKTNQQYLLEQKEGKSTIQPSHTISWHHAEEIIAQKPIANTIQESAWEVWPA